MDENIYHRNNDPFENKDYFDAQYDSKRNRKKLIFTMQITGFLETPIKIHICRTDL